jgi:hypothetical protein
MARKEEELTDNLHQLEILRTRHKATITQRIQECDPDKRSDAWPKHQRALMDQKIKEELVVERKKQLQQIEAASDHPEQTSHIRVLLQAVAEAEDEREYNRRWLQKQEGVWVQEEEEFQQKRLKRDLAFRQRAAAIALQMQYREKQRVSLRAQMSRMEHMLLDLEETFSKFRRRLHEYDQDLTTMIREKEALLSAMTQALVVVKERAKACEAAKNEKEAEKASMQSILNLSQSKMDTQGEIETMEMKIDQLKQKHPTLRRVL